MNLQDVLDAMQRQHDEGAGAAAAAVSITTNQAGAIARDHTTIVSYATGTMSYTPPREFTREGMPVRGPARLTATGKHALDYLFDNRERVYSEGGTGAGLGSSYHQQFDITAPDKLGFEISGSRTKQYFGEFTLLSWGNEKFRVSLNEVGDVLVGAGPSVGNGQGISTALYTVAFCLVVGTK